MNANTGATSNGLVTLFWSPSLATHCTPSHLEQAFVLAYSKLNYVAILPGLTESTIMFPSSDHFLLVRRYGKVVENPSFIFLVPLQPLPVSFPT